MSDKFFFNGKPLKQPKQPSHNFKTNRATRPGTEESPINLVVTSEDRKAEVQQIADEQKLVAKIVIDKDGTENISELDIFINKPKTIVVDKTPNRNDPCSCGSGKKYKKCCA